MIWAATAGVSLNPDTPPEMMAGMYCEFVDLVLVMMREPGLHTGQQFMPVKF